MRRPSPLARGCKGPLKRLQDAVDVLCCLWGPSGQPCEFTLECRPKTSPMLVRSELQVLL